MIYNLDDTICAQSTPSGRGGIHVIRVSGTKSLAIAKQLMPELSEVSRVDSHKVYYGNIIDPITLKKIDEVLLTYFNAGRSFTSEDTVEISCHGNPVIVKLILDLLIKSGCRIAERGEFTYRAYKAGRLTLPQAEAVLSLIDANTKTSVSKSLDLLVGDSLNSFKDFENQLIWVVSRLEARIDFSTEDIVIETDSELLSRLNKLKILIESALANYKNQIVLDKGLKTLIIGPPNAGKSSLFNRLLGTSRSIVSSVPGTTRDYLTETIHIHGLPFQVIDTAGLRLEADEIEKFGIGKVNELVSIADLIIILLGADNINFDFLKMIETSWSTKRLILAVNKIDLESNLESLKNSIGLNLISDDLLLNADNLICALKNPVMISILNDLGIDSLITQMTTKFETYENSNQLEIINLRHSEAMQITFDQISKAIQVLDQHLGDEYVLSHLNSALKSLLSIRSESNEEIIRDKIFKDFCLGK